MTKNIKNIQPTTSLNVAASATAIYQNGELMAVSIEELIDNDVALRQLVNNHNVAVRDNERLQSEIQQLHIESVGYKLQSPLLVGVAIVNIVGVVVVGLSINQLTSTPPSPGAGWFLASGCVLSLLGSIAPVVLPTLTSYITQKGRHAN